MSLDIYFKDPTATYAGTLSSRNITHNLGEMAKEAGVYQHLWHPEDIGVSIAEQLIGPLEGAIKKMKAHPEYFKSFDSLNGWGTYRDFLPWLEEVLDDCRHYPKALISVSR